jgi:NAD(P)-dependent dehydrogenase (short-subunit alcohol dehydrogenase family)
MKTKDDAGSFEEKLNAIRGFTEEELNACLKVLEKIAPKKARNDDDDDGKKKKKKKKRTAAEGGTEKEEEKQPGGGGGGGKETKNNKNNKKTRNDDEPNEDDEDENQRERYYDEETLEERREDEDEEEAGEEEDGGTKRAAARRGTSSSFKTVIELKQHKRLRTSLLPLVEYFTAKLYRGQDPAEYREQKQSRRARNDRNQRMRALDREVVAKTKLREERLRKLRRLEETNFNASSETELLEWKRETDAARKCIGNGMDDGSAGDVENEGKQNQLSGMLVPDGVVEEEEDGEKLEETLAGAPQNTLHNPNACYCCKKRFTEVHHFYASMCPSCAEENYFRRHFTCDMRGRYCIVTGARVKIGFRVALKLLKAGAFVVATTRFPEDARERFKKTDEELLKKRKQKESFMNRLKIVAMDLRDLPALEKLCEKLNKELPRLDVIINNACQTVRRPPTYYKHLLKGELVKKKERREQRKMIGNGDGEEGGGEENGNTLLTTTTDNNDDDDDEWTVPMSVLQSQLEVLEKDKEFSATDETSAMTTTTRMKTNAVFPENVFDVNGQQVDLRTQNSWTMKLGEIETPELLEVLAVNAAAPFVLNGKLRALMKRTAMELPVPTTTTTRGEERRCAFIVNVSAMEGKFYRYKTANHPHTNMAKAALNMMTATCAKDYKKDFIYMTCVDTGWINDENPLPVASRIAKEHNFQTPIDEEDAAARVVGPIFESVADDEEKEKDGDDDPLPSFRKTVWPPKSGVFLKDYRESEW